MQTNTNKIIDRSRDIIQPTTGIYPLTSLGISFLYHCDVDLLICRKNGRTSEILAETPELNINTNNNELSLNVADKYTNGMMEALDKKILPSVILCTPAYEHLHDLINELIEIALELSKRDLLKVYGRLNRFYFPTIMLASNGIIYDEVIYNIQTKLKEKNLNENIIINICSKIIRATIMQGAYRENNLYHPNKKGLIKIAVPRYDLFMPVVELLNDKKFTFSIHTNPYKIEFEKAIINIASNSVALIYSLDKKNYTLNKIDMRKALSPDDPIQAQFVKELQTAIFEIGKKVGAFSESESFEKIWFPRKEQILKHDSDHISSSLYCFKNMIETGTFPEGLPSKERGLIYPLKCFASHFKLNKSVALFEELEEMIIKNIKFAQKHSKDIILTF